MIIGLAITKEMGWRGTRQEFSNVYHYDVPDNNDQVVDNLLLDHLITLERAIHSNEITFKMGRSWGPTGQGPSNNFTRVIRDLTGTGGATSSSNIYRELAVLVEAPLGRYGSKNRPQKLRKWLHCLNTHGYPLSGEGLNNAPSAAITNYMNGILNPTVSANNINYSCGISTVKGQRPVGPFRLYPYLEHRQLGR